MWSSVSLVLGVKQPEHEADYLHVMLRLRMHAALSLQIKITVRVRSMCCSLLQKCSAHGIKSLILSFYG
jgi:hypothetical protein